MVYSKNIKCTSRIFVYYFDTTITSFRFRTVSGVLKIKRITSRTSGIHSESTVSSMQIVLEVFDLCSSSSSLQVSDNSEL